jgi:hypothetical protein
MGDVVVLAREFPSEVNPLEVRIIFRVQARIHCDSLGSLEDEPVVSANRKLILVLCSAEERKRAR